MFKFIIVIFAIIACVAAKPSLIGAPLSYAAPAAAVIAAPAPIVTARSSQVIARNHNGIAAAPLVAAAAYSAPVVAAAAYAAPYVAAPAHFAYSAHLAAAPVLW